MKMKKILLGLGLLAFSVSGGPQVVKAAEMPAKVVSSQQTYEDQRGSRVDQMGQHQQDMDQDRDMEQQMSMDQGSPGCDPFHLGLCQEESSCEAAGGHWYDQTCHRWAEEQVEQCVARAQARHYHGEDPLMDPSQERYRVRADRAVVGCELMVPPEDQGKEAMLAMFAYCPDHPEWGWIDVSPMLIKKQVRLGQEVPVEVDVDLSGLSGMRFQVCGGYIAEDGTIGYHCFEVDIQ